MSIETDVKLTLKAEDRASAVVTGLQNRVDALAKSVAALAKINVPGLQAATKANIAPKAANPFRLDPKAADALKTRFTAEARLARQRTTQAAAEDRQRRQFESAAIRAFRERQAAAAKATRQRLAEIGAIDRANRRAADAAERDAASTLRRQIAGDRWRFQLRNRMDRQERTDRERARKETIGRGRDAWQHGRDAVRDTTRPVGVAALAGSAAATAATRKILTAESAVDAAEINAQSYGGLSKEAARDLRDNWAAPLAETLGVESAKLLTAWTDSVKLGIPAAGAKAVAELTTQTSAAWEVPFEQVSDILGTVNSILTSKGDKFDAGKLKSVANTIQHLAANQSTTPEKLLSYLQRGAGGAQVLGMSQESGLAFGSASTSLGNQAGTSGRLMDHVASRLMQTPRIAKKRGDEGDAARDFVRALGYGTAESMEMKRRADPDAFLPDFFDRFNKIRNPKQQDKALNYFFQKEFLGEGGRIVKGAETYKEAVKLSKEAKQFDAIGKVWELHRTKLSFVFKQFRASFLNVLGEFGKVISPMARQAGDYFLGWSAQLRNGGLAARFQAGLKGLIEGLGFRNLPALLEGVFGKPGEGSAGSIKAWGDAARGFGAGLKDAGSVIKGLFSVFTAGDTSPETVGRWTARILALSAALLILSPVLTVLGGLASAILAIGTAAAATFSAFKVASILGNTAGRTVGGLGLIAGRLVSGLVGGLGLAIVAELGTRRGEIATLMLEATKGLFASMVQGIRDALAEWKQGGLVNGVLRFLDPNFAPDPAKAPSTQKPEIGADRGVIDKALDWFRGTPPAPATTWRDPPAKATVEKQSYGIDPAALRSLIQPASMQVDGDDRPADQHGRVALDVVSLASAGRVIGESFLERIMGRLVVEAPVAGRPATAEKTTSDDAWRGLLVPATFRVIDDLGDGVERLNRTLATFGSKGLSSSLTTPSTAPSTAFGSAGDVTAGFSSSTSSSGSGGGRQVPGWYGRGSGGNVDYDSNVNTNDGRRSRGATTAEGKARVASWQAFLEKPVDAGGLGMPPGKAQATIAMMQGESGGNLDPKAAGDHKNGVPQSFGTAQWNVGAGRFGKLQALAQKMGKPWQDIEVQQAFLRQEMLGSHRAAYDAMMAAKTDEGTLRAGIAKFENPQKHDLAHQIRLPFLNRLRGQGGDAPGGQAGPVVGGVHPLDGKGRFSSDFGMRRHPITGQSKFHAGVDLAAPAGTVVQAMRDGIASIDRSGDVKLAHDDGSSTTYRHIQAGIEAGAKVASGQAIGRLRAHDPRSTGPHLHLEARDPKGNLFDPKRLLAGAPVPTGMSPEAQRAAKSLAIPKTDIGDGMTSTGWRKAGELAGQPAPSAPTPPSAADLASKVPLPPARPKGIGGAHELEDGKSGPKPNKAGPGGNGGSNAPGVSIVIHAGNQSPTEMASQIQRHVTEAWGNRAHDLEPEYS
ncbi:phage tail tape measure protein [Methylobacterium sp. 88A]|uniref:phage tail tape measure protein n=1 Tax=Methylobacterium sp. 88A TaxID=1131813 RepID=UPI0003A090E8|nr:phage tail tape measure protein [Methylobacterium sp. 88A]